MFQGPRHRRRAMSGDVNVKPSNPRPTSVLFLTSTIQCTEHYPLSPNHLQPQLISCLSLVIFSTFFYSQNAHSQSIQAINLATSTTAAINTTASTSSLYNIHLRSAIINSSTVLDTRSCTSESPSRSRGRRCSVHDSNKFTRSKTWTTVYCRGRGR